MIPQDQGSPAWREWRKGKIGASDAAACMGISPWQTPYELWLDKMGQSQTKYVSPAMLRGSALEEEARSLYESITGNVVFPEVRVHPDFEWAIASLDGICLHGKILVEIKCPNKATHDKAGDGIIEPHYMAQIQHQLWVTDLDMAHYFSYDGTMHHLVTVKRDEEFIKHMIFEEVKMLRCIETGIPPELTEKEKQKNEEVDLSKDDDWLSFENLYLYYNVMLNQAETGMKSAKEKLQYISDGRNIKGSRIKFSKVTRAGNVDYSQIPELEGVNLDDYRKDAIVSYRITIDKE